MGLVGMILIPAPGSLELQSAIENNNVQKIVDILLQIIRQDSIVEQDFFRVVARFLKNFGSRTLPNFEKGIQALRLYHKRGTNNKGEYSIPPVYVDELISALEILYEQSQEVLGYQRGAIVELISTELVCSRCSHGECFDNQIFAHRASRYRSNQVDVVVFSQTWQEIEGYTCKISPQGLSSPDCTNLTALYKKAQELDFKSHVGAICFETSRVIMQKINRLPLDAPIYAYGTDNIRELEENPF